MIQTNYGYEICKHCRKIFHKTFHTDSFCCENCKNQFELIRKENIEHVEKSRYIIFERDEFRCIYCGKSSIEDGVKLHIDHIISFSSKMDNNIYNLITSCEECNMTKGTKDIKPSVYHRIIEVNTRRTNSKLSEDTILFLNTVMDKHFNDQKLSNRIKKLMK